MTILYCDLCKYKTSIKCNYIKHLDTKNHKSKTEVYNSITPYTLKNEQKSVINENNCGIKPASPERSSINHLKSGINPIKDQEINSDLVCDICKSTFSNKSNLNRHKKNKCSTNINTLCDMNTVSESNILKEKIHKLEVEKLKLELLAKERENALIKQAKDKEAELHKEVSKLLLEAKQKAEETADSFKSSLKHTEAVNEAHLSALKYVMTKFFNAPAIEQLPQLTHIGYNNDEQKYARTIISKFNNNLLAKFCGDLIIKHYKTNDRSKQSIWSTDNSRYHYVIKRQMPLDKIKLIKDTEEEYDSDNKNQFEIDSDEDEEYLNDDNIDNDNEGLKNTKSKWIMDKKGRMWNNSYIIPFVQDLRKIIVKYEQELVKPDDDASTGIIIEYANKQKTISKILRAIDYHVLERDIFRYVSPHFYLTK